MNPSLQPVALRRLSTLVAGACMATLLAAPSARAGAELKVGDDYSLKLSLLFQPWVQLTSDPLSDTDLASDFFLRRTRIIMAGQVSKKVSFFFETDNPNWGKGGNFTPDFFVQDAYVSYDFGDEAKLDLGMLLPPFVHMARQGAGNLHTLDYHGDVIKFPKGGKVWRDMGVGLRGLLADKKLDYRLTITNGKVGAVDDIPRFTARFAFNLFDAEEGNFLGGTYLGQKKLLSFGVACDVQPDVVDGGEVYYALGADVFLDMPLDGGNRISGQLDFVYYRGLDGKKPVLDADGNPVLDANGNPTTVDALLDTTGMGLLFDIGYAFGLWEPIIGFDWFKPEGASELKAQFLGIHLGLNWWFQGHTANLKLDLGLVKAAGREFGDAARVFTLQSQLLF